MAHKTLYSWPCPVIITFLTSSPTLSLTPPFPQWPQCCSLLKDLAVAIPDAWSTFPLPPLLRVFAQLLASQRGLTTLSKIPTCTPAPHTWSLIAWYKDQCFFVMFIVYGLSLHARIYAPWGQEPLSILFSNLPQAVFSTQEALSKYLLTEWAIPKLQWLFPMCQLLH